MQADGSPLYGYRRQVTIAHLERRLGSPSFTREHKKIVRDDGIVQYDFTPSHDAEFIKIRVTLPLL